MNSITNESIPSWINEELQSLDLADERLNKRAKLMLSDQYAHPNQPLHGSARDEAASKGAWRFQNNIKTDDQALLAAHYQSVVARAKGRCVVFGVHDTSELHFATQTQKAENGTLRSKKDLGFLVHPTVIFTPEKLSLGSIDVNLWSRDPSEYGKSKARANRPIEEKESYRWLLSYRQLVRFQQELPHTEVISISDAESDIYELFLETQNHSQGPHLLLRAAYNRSLDDEVEKLWPHMEKHSSAFEMEIEIPRKGTQAARLAQIQVSFAPIHLKTPNSKQGSSIALYAVYAREIHPPEGVEALNWMLLSTRKVRKAKHALTLMNWYACRWQIDFFQNFENLVSCFGRPNPSNRAFSDEFSL